LLRKRVFDGLNAFNAFKLALATTSREENVDFDDAGRRFDAVLRRRLAFGRDFCRRLPVKAI
jgi:hypothetical protein